MLEKTNIFKINLKGEKHENNIISFCALIFINTGFAQVNFQWFQIYSGEANRLDRCEDMRIDNNGNIIITGYSKRNSEGTGWDYLTLKYDS